MPEKEGKVQINGNNEISLVDVNKHVHTAHHIEFRYYKLMLLHTNSRFIYSLLTSSTSS
jgi:hypothetical protein